MSDPVSTSTTHAGPVVASVLGILLIAGIVVAPWEGYSPTPYRDAVQVLTVCRGHTGNVEDRPYSKAECERLFRSDLGEAWQTVERCITGPMTDYQAAALTSFAYNVGPGGKGIKDGLCWLKSGSMPRVRRYANAGDWPRACAALEDWVYAGGRKLRGLERRRAAERALCDGKWEPS
jgi:lysozyme